MRSDSASRSRASVVENTLTPVNFGRLRSTPPNLPGAARACKDVAAPRSAAPLHRLDDDRDPLATADAGSAEPVAGAPAAQLVQQVHGDARPAGGQRVAHGDGAAVDVRPGA